MGAGSIVVLEGILGGNLDEAAEVLNGRDSRSQFVGSDPRVPAASRSNRPRNDERPAERAFLRSG